ncbi:hypothetical protein TNCV_268041 [Trichonephila clavipes]|nr:hypothetical protein TNCV_268041 [Trichonephila clavipes]
MSEKRRIGSRNRLNDRRLTRPRELVGNIREFTIPKDAQEYKCKKQKRYAAFLSRRESITGESPISFPEDASMPYSGFEPELTRLQVERHNHHTRWDG